jgi:hypothetical protein
MRMERRDQLILPQIEDIYSSQLLVSLPQKKKTTKEKNTGRRTDEPLASARNEELVGVAVCYRMRPGVVNLESCALQLENMSKFDAGWLEMNGEGTTYL